LQLLAQDLPEQSYQRFIEEHTQLVPHEFVQNHGIHFSLAFRKLTFGTNYKSDFFYLSKSSDDWNCVFIELERPQARLFRPKSNDFGGDFLAGLNQIDAWRAWFLDDANKQYLINSTLGDVRRPLAHNPCYMKFVLVMGRRAEYENDDTRRRLVKAKEADDFKIITYDSLLENIRFKFPLFVAARHNEFIDVLSDDLVDDSIFGWMEPERIRVSSSLLDKIKAHRSNSHRMDGGEVREVFRFVENRLRVRPTTP
jgi:hypothetical protein